MNIVWFKRDLRLHDHAPLVEASKKGAILPLYIIEPQLWLQPDMSHRHYQFLVDSLNDLDKNLKKYGGGLILKVGEVVNVLSQLHKQNPITNIYSHEETWNNWTYQRDKEVLAWAQQNRIPWIEKQRNGVFRRLKDRSNWGQRWYQEMRKPLIQLPSKLTFISAHSNSIPKASDLQIPDDFCINRQQGGRTLGIELLNTFLEQRGKNYTKEMSSPVTAFDSCSRLSPHFSFGTLSVREAFHAAENRLKNLRQDWSPDSKSWYSAMRSFLNRLRWHCHFIQKLEDQPSIEFESMHPAYRDIRPEVSNQDFLIAWQEGKTGFPFIDACMRALKASGWINFRMRAMLTSFASYHLWLPWQVTALYLAKQFTDYEPGIHYCQMQMQSGTTGINSIRIYNPLKQSIDQDPFGTFIKEWIPELTNIPEALIHTPWKQPLLMNGYPFPIIDEKSARTKAAKILFGIRKDPNHLANAELILKKHGSIQR
ncbi:MAG: deoxyribodipyrimidine photolyase [Rickettsiales bacterium]|nr:deoxyribodipyrimidine photolyase [Rickettsiales bacterium]|tara:strand:+ start:5400 stop:6842 length:1443 start_codon:yes stop_codon:yes gene_type:complete